MARREPEAVHVWWDEFSKDGPEWAVSLVDGNDEEVICIGGYGHDLGDAWERACSDADDYGIPAVEFDRLGIERDRYYPEDEDEDEDEDDE